MVPPFTWSIEFERASSSDIARRTMRGPFFSPRRTWNRKQFPRNPFLLFAFYLRINVEGNSARSNEPNFGAGPAANIFSPLPVSVLDGRKRTGNQRYVNSVNFFKCREGEPFFVIPGARPLAYTIPHGPFCASLRPRGGVWGEMA